MLIPSELAKYRQIEPGCIYCDEKSVEEFTGKTKRKYKLAGYWTKYLEISDARLFYVSTSKDYSKAKSTVVCVGKNDYVECFEPTLKTKNSYYDTLSPIVVTKDEINYKTSDPENGFRNVARLKEHAFHKFLEKAKKIKLQQRPPITPKKLAGIIGSFTPSEITDETLRELHLIG